jgi:hypothetical protein
VFDLASDDHTRIKKGLASRVGQDFEGEFEEVEAASNPLDDDEHHRLHGKLLGYYQRELDRQNDNRIQMAIDEDYYDNDQWSQADAEELKDRGQAPICYNVITQSINWVIGSEKRGRSDFKVLPRGKEDAKPAQKKTQLMKYLSDVNRTPFNRSRSFEDAVKVGLGWIESGVTERDNGEPIYNRYESWRNMLWDSASTEFDLSDARYVIRIKWVDLDVAIAMFPERAEMLERSASTSERYGTDLANGDEIMDFAEDEMDSLGRGMSDHSVERRRVRMIEVWFRKPERVQKIVAGQRQGEEFDPQDQNHQDLVQGGESVVAERMMMSMNLCIMTTSGMCYVGRSPYKHNKFPFIPVWGYRRGRDNMPYGMIRAMRDIQDDVNKRASKALFILSANKVIMEEGAVADMGEFLDEVSRPDGVIVKRQGKTLEINTDRELAPAHLDIMSQSINMIQSVSGVTDEQMGKTTNAKSGVAIQARQDQGSKSTSKLFDNLRYAFQVDGEITLSLCEQYFTEQKQFRITNQRGTPDFVDINDGLPENNITRTQADFIISDSEWRASLRQAQAQQLAEMMPSLPPEVQLVLLDLLIEELDLPNGEEMVKRIRQITGMRDPDATEPTPEELQAEQAQAEAQKQQQIMAAAQLRNLNAKSIKDETAAQKTMVDTVLTSMQSQLTAVEAAQISMLNPAILPVADALLHESGYVSKSEEEAQQAQAQAQQDQAAQQEQMQQQQLQEQQMQQQQQEQAQQQQQGPAQSMQQGIPLPGGPQ